jgi:hypothetical protein
MTAEERLLAQMTLGLVEEIAAEWQTAAEHLRRSERAKADKAIRRARELEFDLDAEDVAVEPPGHCVGPQGASGSGPRDSEAPWRSTASRGPSFVTANRRRRAA